MEQRTILAQAPGRINLIGEHTDYNEGFVLPGAVDKVIGFRLTPNGSEAQVTVRAENVGENFSFDLKSFSPVGEGWPNYVMGVVHELLQLGATLQGFDARFEGDLPIGSGMSSSAALECSLATGLNALFDLGLDRWQLIKAAQMAEHHFVGIKCGIMDQFASVMGQEKQLLLLDCRSLEYQYFPCDLGDYRLLLLNTNVSHTLASSEYNTRRSECEHGVEHFQRRYPNITSLRDVSPERLTEQQREMPDTVFRRCRHVVSENGRVLAATRALTGDDLPALGQLLYQSHYSLQHDYEVSCPELDFLVEQTQNRDDILGSRMMGGGFGGCTINIIKMDMADAFIESAARAYRDRFGLELTPYAVSIADGARIMGS